ncbi:thermonuclease family protein [Paracoccus litorisediminis]|uniref:TNase-like domain-containing protein n=1 Tax=Paracoccus litorisediminis TaxID=2006130 RepID=A0A844HHG8_9RHOB|nr:hypothetical protein [Paracoccus litorisediminis]MTH57874.1 hypothetical protein [Paracoccus litorisediminis]
MPVVQFDPRRKKRTVRTKKQRRSLRSLLAKVGMGLGFIAMLYALFNPLKRYPEYVPRLIEMTAVQQVEGPVTHVRDGDTIEVKGVAVRFSSLDCAELGTPAGQRAKVAMQKLVNGKTVRCYLNGGRSYDRFIGSCYRNDGQELASAMMVGGYCARYW